MNTRLTRRACAAMLPLLAFPELGSAQSAYPARSVTLVEGFVPGGGSDIVARLLASRLRDDFGQPVVVENKPGASGTIAAQGVIRATADGYTMMIASPSTLVVVPKATANPPYDSLRDMTPVLQVASVPQVVVVPAKSPFRTLGELITYARANPGKLNYASSGIGAAQHLAAELLSRAAGVKMTHVPYRGSGQAMTDLIAGQVDLNVDTLPSNLPHIKSGAMRALAVTTPERVEWLPDVPTVAESGFPGFERTLWYMIVAPAGLPAPIVEHWVSALNKALAHPETRQRLREAGFMLGGGTAADAAALLNRETEATVKLLREANIRME